MDKIGHDADQDGDTLMKTQDPLVEINLEIDKEPMITYVSGWFPDKLKLKELLREIKDCFVCDYNEMPYFSWKLVEYRLPIKPGYKPYKQPPRKKLNKVEIKVKEKIQRLLKV